LPVSEVRWTVPSSRLNLKVVPGASKNEIVGWMGDVLKVRVSAPPEKGRANAAVCELLAAALGVSVKRVQVVSGETSQRKVVEVPVSEADARARFNSSKSA
jgi:uncharacterized protein (TIGR00251 family)